MAEANGQAPAERRDKPWIFRTYAGHSTARESKNLAKGQTGLSIAFDLPTQTGLDSDQRSVALGCAKEAIAVAAAIGVKMDVGDPIEHIKKLGGKIPNARPSMLLDYNAGRRGEVDAINGSIPPLGKQYGVPTPVNETVVGIIKACEAGFPA